MLISCSDSEQKMNISNVESFAYQINDTTYDLHITGIVSGFNQDGQEVIFSELEYRILLNNNADSTLKEVSSDKIVLSDIEPIMEYAFEESFTVTSKEREAYQAIIIVKDLLSDDTTSAVINYSLHQE